VQDFSKAVGDIRDFIQDTFGSSGMGWAKRMVQWDDTKSKIQVCCSTSGQAN
jgi:hypothetical protein